jgi:hypothetical protein
VSRLPSRAQNKLLRSNKNTNKSPCFEDQPPKHSKKNRLAFGQHEVSGGLAFGQQKKQLKVARLYVSTCGRIAPLHPGPGAST